MLHYYTHTYKHTFVWIYPSNSDVLINDENVIHECKIFFLFFSPSPSPPYPLPKNISNANERHKSCQKLYFPNNRVGVKNSQISVFKKILYQLSCNIN